MSFLKKTEISLSIALITSICLSLISFGHISNGIRDNILRLHVIANSDTDADQKLKLMVRDSILEYGSELFDGSIDVVNATYKLKPYLNKLKIIAEDVIKKEGFDYKVNVSINKEFFSTRTYNEITLPAGEYLALIIRIGEAEGKNWWCVMFPPMCISAADENIVLSSVLSNNELRLVNKNPKFEPRFKVVEIIENIKNIINKQNDKS